MYSLALSLLYGPTLTPMHDYWKTSDITNEASPPPLPASVHTSTCLGSSVPHQPPSHVNSSLALPPPNSFKTELFKKGKGKRIWKCCNIFIDLISCYLFFHSRQYSLTSCPYFLSSFSQPTPIWLQPSSLSDATRSSVTFLFLTLRDVFQSLCCLTCWRHLTL